MIEHDLTRRLPRPVNLGALLMLLTLPVGVVTVGMLAIGAESSFGEPFTYLSCTVPAPPDLLIGLLCSLLTLGMTVLPVWWIFPPTRRAVEQDAEGLVWDRTRMQGGTRLFLICLAIAGLGIGWSAALTRSVEYNAADSGYAGGLDSCSSPPPWVERSIQVRRSKGLGVLLGYGALSVFAAWLVRRRWRPATRLELDERGLLIDGRSWSFKDITRAEVVDDALILDTHDDRHAVLPLYPREVAFAQRLAGLIRTHLPAETEARTEARAAIEGLAERSPTG